MAKFYSCCWWRPQWSYTRGCATTCYVNMSHIFFKLNCGK